MNALLLMLVSVWAQPSEEARTAVRSILAQVRPGKAKSVAAGGCPRIPAQKWIGYLLVGEPIEHEFKFGKGCDLEGKVVIRREPFPVDLKIRGLKEGNRLRAVLEPILEPNLMKQNALATVRVKKGRLTGAGDAEVLGFTADYAMLGGFDGKIRENRGGTLKAEAYRGKAVNVSEKLLFE